MKNISLLGVCLFSLLTMVSGCKEKVSGCMDIDAANVDVTANEDCCCKFTGRSVFWYDQAASVNLQQDSIMEISYYVNGELKGTVGTDVFYAHAPECGEPGVLTITSDMGDKKTTEYTYETRDQNGTLMWSGIKTFQGGKCNNVQLVY